MITTAIPAQLARDTPCRRRFERLLTQDMYPAPSFVPKLPGSLPAGTTSLIIYTQERMFCLVREQSVDRVLRCPLAWRVRERPGAPG